MKNNSNYILIVAGGSGTRLWPFSRKNSPKQFNPLKEGKSLFQEMLSLSKDTVGLEKVFVVCSEDLSVLVKEQCPDLLIENIIIEPCPRDNFPAIILGSWEIYKKDKFAKIAIVWSDHYILNKDIFFIDINKSFDFLENDKEPVLVVGTKPVFPETGFGYIKKGKRILEDIFNVSSFYEKPSYRKANRFCRSGKYLWNTGYKVFLIKTFLEDINLFYPNLGNLLEKKEIDFYDLPAGSIEDLYTNKKKRVFVLESELKWSDVGNWSSLLDLFGLDSKKIDKKEGPRVDSNNISIDGVKKVVACVGVNNLIVVERDDVLMILDKDSVHQVKKLHQIIKEDYPDML